MLKDAIAANEPSEVTQYRHDLRGALASWSCAAGDWKSAGRLPRSLFAQLGHVGIFRRRWSADANRGVRYALALTDEATKVSPSVGLAVSIHSEVFCGLLAEPRTEYLAGVREAALDGAVVGCVGSTESRGGSSIASPGTTAELVGGEWRVVGEKRYITDASLASHAIVAATASGGSRRGPTLFVVDLCDRGVERLGGFETVGMRACDTSALRFDVLVPDDARVCAAGTGLVRLSKSLQSERLLGAQQVLTSARVALGLAIAYLGTRTVDGKLLSERQALRHRAADAITELLAAEALVGQIADRVAAGRPVDREIAAAKLFASGVACRVVDQAMQFFGGRGYTTNFPIEELWRDVRVGRIGGGTDEIMRDIVANSIEKIDAETVAKLVELCDRDAPTLSWGAPA